MPGDDGYYGNGAIAVGKGLVFDGCAIPDTGGGTFGGVCAYSESTGQKVWGDGIGCGCVPDGVLSSPLAYSNGVIYVGLSGGANNKNQSGIFALNAKTGAVLWGTTSGSEG